MPFESGTFSVSMFQLVDAFPEDRLERFSARRAGKLDEVKDEVQIGWVSGRHLLESRIDDETAILGGYLYIFLRKAQRKIPPALLKAECKLEELAYIQSTGNPDVPRKVKREIKETVEKKRLPMIVPQISGVPMVLDHTRGALYIGATSQKQLDEFNEFLMETLKITPPYAVTPEAIMAKLGKDPRNYKGLPFFGVEEEEIIAGRDFLTWLWYFSETASGELEIDGMGRFAAMVDGPLNFAAEGKGSYEAVVKNGNPLRSAEARAALNVGKKLKKAKVIFARGNEVWSANLDADKFVFGSVSLPEGEEMDYASRFAERVQYLNMLRDVVSAYFNRYLEDLAKAKSNGLLDKMREWAETRDGL